MTISKFWRDWLVHQVKEYAEPWAIDKVDAAFSGNVEAAVNLSYALGNSNRGHVAVAMWEAKIPVVAFRSYFSSVWEHDHRFVIDAAKSGRRLSAMFKYANFQLPDDMPDVVRVWRGTSALTEKEAGKGYSWTIDRDTACWFAMRFAKDKGSPVVLVADIPKRDIALFHTDRNENEAVLLKPPAHMTVDGDAIDWDAGFHRAQARIKATVTPPPDGLRQSGKP